MNDDGLEILIADANMKLLLYFEIFEVKVIYSD